MKNLSKREEKLIHKRINGAINNKINTFSYTISPSNKQGTEIESFYTALKYYKDAKCRSIIVQPKYMGSYVDVYLNLTDLSLSYIVSRNGYIINDDWLNKNKNPDIHTTVHDLVIQLYNNLDIQLLDKLSRDKIKIAIIACELLPWGAVGNSYIERDFVRYNKLHESYCKDLEELNLFELINTYKQTTKDKTSDKYHEQKFIENIDKLEILDKDKYQQENKKYKENIYNYYVNTTPYLKPFDVYKVIDINDKELIVDNIEYTSRICKVPFVEITFGSKNYQDKVNQALDLMSKIEDDNGEGIVVKPNRRSTNIAPMLKVRFNSYLSLIYGINFVPKYDYYLERRNIKRKLKSSINDYKLWYDLLKIPLKEINKDNEEFKALYRSKILQENYNKLNDTRL